MEPRKSKRVAAKVHARLDLGGNRHGGDDRVIGRHTSVGGAMGLTPAKPKGRNLVIAKATSAAGAAAARLDQLNAEGQQHATKRSRSQARKKGERVQATAGREQTGASTYQAKSRESMLLYQTTEHLFDEEEGERKDDGHDLDGMPALDSEGSSEHSGSDSKNDERESSVIVTPGPTPKQTKSDEEFIAPEDTPDGDPDYELTEDTEGTDADDEGDDEMDRGPNEADWQEALKAAAREARAKQEEAEARERAEAMAQKRAKMQQEAAAKAREERHEPP